MLLSLPRKGVKKNIFVLTLFVTLQFFYSKLCFVFPSPSWRTRIFTWLEHLLTCTTNYSYFYIENSKVLTFKSQSNSSCKNNCFILFLSWHFCRFLCGVVTKEWFSSGFFSFQFSLHMTTLLLFCDGFYWRQSSLHFLQTFASIHSMFF